MHHFDAIRGEDSSGMFVAQVKEGGYNTSVFKQLGTPSFLWGTYRDNFDDGVFTGTGVHCLMGHNRFRTQGEITAENAHPFEFENVIGAHNGTCAAYITKDLHDAGKYQIDSQKIFSQLNHDGDVANLWKQIDDSQTSAAALTWWDKRTNSFNFIRNSQRPLYLSVSKGGDTLYWASEKWMLQVALSRCGVSFTDIEEAEVHHHHQLRFWEGKAILEKTKVEQKKWVYQPPQTQYKPKSANWDAFTVVAVDKQAPIPYVVLKDDKGVEYIAKVVNDLQNEVFNLIDNVSNHIGKNEPLIVVLDRNMSYEISSGGDKGLRFSVLQLMTAIKEDYEEVFAPPKETQNSPQEEEEEEDVGINTSTWHDGSKIRGKKLRRALRNVGNACCICEQSHITPSSPEIVGSEFKTAQEFVCGECIIDGWWEYYQQSSYTYPYRRNYH